PPTTAKRLSAAVPVEVLSWANAGAATARAGTRARVRIRMDCMGESPLRSCGARGVGGAERRSMRMNGSLPRQDDRAWRSAKTPQAAWLLACPLLRGFSRPSAACMRSICRVHVMRRWNRIDDAVTYGLHRNLAAEKNAVETRLWRLAGG